MKLFNNAKTNHFLATHKKHKKCGKKHKKEVSAKQNKRRRMSYYDILSKADFLQRSPPKSELWFQELFKSHKLHSDHYNEEFKYSIPDVINHIYKYIIEIDGSIHNLESVQKRDAEKELKFKKHGYKVIRIKAYDTNSFETALEIRDYLIKRQNPVK